MSIIVKRDSLHVATILLDRLAARNAINREVAMRLHESVEATERDPDIWAVVLASAHDGIFSAGADLKEVAAGRINDLYVPSAGFAGFVDARRTKPWIAAIDGLALAGGFELALACDLIVASEKSFFGLPEVSRGLIAAAGGLYRLPRRLPAAVALEIALTAHRLPAQRAYDLGLVNRLAEDGSAIAAAQELADEIVRNAPLAVRETLAIMRQASAQVDPALNSLSLARQEVLSRTEDFAEGPQAFVEKRAPNWQAR
jgi:enoyl-CoA hydratase/carnithine racemase